MREIRKPAGFDEKNFAPVGGRRYRAATVTQ
jgi:hypothetical protein